MKKHSPYVTRDELKSVTDRLNAKILRIEADALERDADLGAKPVGRGTKASTKYTRRRKAAAKISPNSQNARAHKS